MVDEGAFEASKVAGARRECAATLRAVRGKRGRGRPALHGGKKCGIFVWLGVARRFYALFRGSEPSKPAIRAKLWPLSALRPGKLAINEPSSAPRAVFPTFFGSLTRKVRKNGLGRGYGAGIAASRASLRAIMAVESSAVPQVHGPFVSDGQP